ncbi:MAG: hypothetical protein KJO82_16055, partial [Gammaproteobacteria bacterium]|nr:hypothetical protein [Gammaproteobacteria bacterium]
MKSEEHEEQGRPARKDDVTGRDRLAVNLASRYLGQIVVIVSGFIIPRLIDDGLGPVALGIWDFGWSTVSYFRYIGFGFAAGLNRFVALYNARESYANLQKAVASTAYLQILLSMVTVLAAFGVSALMPHVFDEIPPDQLEQSKMVVFLLGCTLAVKMLFWPARGILTGYHRVTVTAGVTAVGDIVILVGMFVVLTTGGNLVGLGMVVLFSMIATEMTRMFMAKRVYPYRVLNWSVVSMRMVRKMVVFGVKNSLAGMPGLIVIQTIALCLAASAGPAALAY